MSLDYYKWDSQVGDTPTLFQQPLFISPYTWEELKATAENLAAELTTAEQELFNCPGLDAVIGFSPKLHSVFMDMRRKGPVPDAMRTLRFDFHYTTNGWHISEVNSDVPGGYSEASCFTNMMAHYFPNTLTTGDVANKWTEAMMTAIGERKHVALLSAPGFLEDQQVTAFLASQLQSRGVETLLFHHPAQLSWQSGRAGVVSNGQRVDFGAIVRFYQGEWLAALPENSGWRWLFAQGKTPVANPGISLLTENKRWPLAWEYMRTKMPIWRALLPECRDPRDPCWQSSDQWVVKGAFSNTGDAVYSHDTLTRKAWGDLCNKVARNPTHWVVQRRFEPLPIFSDAGEIYPCIGVYTVNGRAAGVYTRMGYKSVVDYSAKDGVLLIKETDD
jgi:glutathionylspermidine synthase